MGRIIGVIPARMAASRFPGKPLAPLVGRPMVEHVYWRSALCGALDEVVVATCDDEIVSAVAQFGGTAVLTSNLHQRASDRVAEVAGRVDADIVVLIQGDEPMIVPEMISMAIEPLLNDPNVVCSNLIAPIRSEEEFQDPNTIKVTVNKAFDALYFSREPIPTRQCVAFSGLPAFKQVCVIPFRRDFLMKLAALPPTRLEQVESIDMLRALEHGYPIRLVPIEHNTHSVDTPADLALVEEMMKNDPLLSRYPRRVRR